MKLSSVHLIKYCVKSKDIAHTVMLKFYHTILQLNLPALCALWQESRDTENIIRCHTDREKRNVRIFRKNTFVVI